MSTQTPWYVHDLNPIAFTMGGEAIPWYWLNYLAGFFWCYFGLRYLTSRDPSKSTLDDVTQFAVCGWFGMLIGARVTYILFYNLHWFETHPEEIFALWNGGMSFHGGLAGAAIATWIVTVIRRIDFLSLTDKLALLIPWPLATGRICNFLNGELPGRPTAVSWAVVFPEPWNDFPRHPSQLYEAITEGLILGLLLLWAWRIGKNQRGILSALFLAGYGSLRFLTEFTREPDPQLGFILKGITLGQLLCLIMIAAGALIVAQIPISKTPERHDSL